MNSRNPVPRRVWTGALQRVRWRRFRGSAGNARRVPFCGRAGQGLSIKVRDWGPGWPGRAGPKVPPIGGALTTPTLMLRFQIGLSGSFHFLRRGWSPETTWESGPHLEISCHGKV